jgi:hypothetical protein
MICRLRRFCSQPYAKWIAIFLASNVFIHPDDDPDYGANPESRFAALCAMVEDHSFQIDHYRSLTIDWAHTPDGHFYSNKAPGPILLAYPVFWMIDGFWTGAETDRATRDRIRISHRALSLSLLSLLLQALPFAIMTAAAIGWLQECGVSPVALHLSCLAVLFGNTASLFMNTFFGHGMAGTCVLSMCLCLLKRWYTWAGLAYGLALLADYSAALLVPGFLVVAILRVPRDDRFAVIGAIALGGLLPGILWVGYHISCFGGVLTLPGRFQNPIFVDTAQNDILGLFSLAPQPSIAARLLVGLQRGILWTQPWLLLLLLSCIHWRILIPRLGECVRQAALQMMILLLPAMFLLLWMNASFGEWQGGWAPGPRYMCCVFPAFGLLTGLLYDELPLGFRRLLIAGIVFSVVFWILASSTQILVPSGQTMWGFMLRLLMGGDSFGAIIRFAGLVVLFEWRLYGLIRRPGRVPDGEATEGVSKSI